MKGLQDKSSHIIRTDETLTVQRDGPVMWVDGVSKTAGAKRFDIRGNVQPMAGRDLLLVPEGDRFKENLWLFTFDEVFTNDLVIRRGINYQVQTVENWGNFRQCRITRKDVGYDRTP